MNNTWLPMKFAPTDRDIQFISNSKEGLPVISGVIRYHNDAGFMVDEFRDTSYWKPLNNICPFCLNKHIEFDESYFCNTCDELMNVIMHYHLDHTVTIEESIELLAPDLDPRKKEFIAYWWTA